MSIGFSTSIKGSINRGSSLVVPPGRTETACLGKLSEYNRPHTNFTCVCDHAGPFIVVACPLRFQLRHELLVKLLFAHV